MRLHRLFLLSIISCLFLHSCSEKSENHPILKYYPSEDIFEEGYVNKYYEHYYPKSSSQSASTRIIYSLYKKISKEQFIQENYNAGFWLTGIRIYHVDEYELYLDSSVNIWRSDTTVTEIEEGLVSNWNTNKIEGDHYVVKSKYGDRSFYYSSNQQSSKDSIVNGSPAKIFRQSASRIIIDKDTTETNWHTTSYYLEDLGYFGATESHEDYTWKVELIEQMPVAKFRKLADHNEKRVAYIDPDETLDKGSDFKICGHEKFIYDYYNSTPDGDYLYGKAALVDTILMNLDADKMMNQTGMLTFRFVVNCKGEAGRFIAKGYDLNFQPYEFPVETINHLYELILKLKEWREVVINEESRDAYFYFTFKLNNGEITDILP